MSHRAKHKLSIYCVGSVSHVKKKNKLKHVQRSTKLLRISKPCYMNKSKKKKKMEVCLICWGGGKLALGIDGV